MTQKKFNLANSIFGGFFCGCCYWYRGTAYVWIEKNLALWLSACVCENSHVWVNLGSILWKCLCKFTWNGNERNLYSLNSGQKTFWIFPFLIFFFVNSINVWWHWCKTKTWVQNIEMVKIVRTPDSVALKSNLFNFLQIFDKWNVCVCTLYMRMHAYSP